MREGEGGVLEFSINAGEVLLNVLDHFGEVGDGGDISCIRLDTGGEKKRSKRVRKGWRKGEEGRWRDREGG